MISIKKFLRHDDSESAAFERMSQLLLHAIGLHAVEGDRGDYDGFRSEITSVQTSLADDPSPANVVVLAGTVVQAMQDYNRRTSQFVRAQETELQSIVGMLTQAMTQISLGSRTSIARLQELQKQIEHAKLIEDIRTLKANLSECLESIHAESIRQREESARIVAELDQGIRKTQDPDPAQVSTAPEVELDLLTGTRVRVEGEAALRAACEGGAHLFAGLFVVDRLRAISSRFGDVLGEEVLKLFFEHLSKTLTDQDRVFRWSEDSFLVVLPRQEPAEQVRLELGRFLSRRVDHTFEIGARSVAVPIASTWMIVPLFDSNFAQVLRSLEAFTARCGSL